MYLSPGRHPTLPTVLKRRQPFSLSLSLSLSLLDDIFSSLLLATRSSSSGQRCHHMASVHRIFQCFHVANWERKRGEKKKKKLGRVVEAIVAQGGWLLTSD